MSQSFTALLEYLRGKRTYLVSTILVLTAILSWIDGDATKFETVQNILIALGLSSLRAGVANDMR